MRPPISKTHELALPVKVMTPEQYRAMLRGEYEPFGEKP